MKKEKMIPIELANFGGFFEDAIISELEKKYEAKIVYAVLNEYRIGPYLYELCDETEKEYKKIEVRSSSRFLRNEIEEKEKERKNFNNWYIAQFVRCLSNKLEKKENPFWNKFELNIIQKAKMKSLTAVQERILAYMCGEIDGKKYSITELANHPEYNCSPEWIKKVLTDEKINNSLDIEDIKEILQIDDELVRA